MQATTCCIAQAFTTCPAASFNSMPSQLRFCSHSSQRAYTDSRVVLAYLLRQWFCMCKRHCGRCSVAAEPEETHQMALRGLPGSVHLSRQQRSACAQQSQIKPTVHRCAGTAEPGSTISRVPFLLSLLITLIALLAGSYALEHRQQVR